MDAVLNNTKLNKKFNKIYEKNQKKCEITMLIYDVILQQINSINEQSILAIQKNTVDDYSKCLKLQKRKNQIISNGSFKMSERLSESIKTDIDKMRLIYNQYSSALTDKLSAEANWDGSEIKDNMFQIAKDILHMRSKLKHIMEIDIRLMREKFLIYMAFNVVKYNEIINNRKMHFNDNVAKFVFAKDITSVLNLVKSGTLKTNIEQDDLSDLEWRTEGITEDILVPILANEYKSLQALFKSAETQKVDIPFLRSESKIRHMFGAFHDNKTMIYPELPAKYDLEY